VATVPKTITGALVLKLNLETKNKNKTIAVFISLLRGKLPGLVPESK
jgi:hypothetical protein